MANSLIEMVEATYPVMVEEYAYEPDTEGPGRHRGGLGVRRQIRVLSPGGAILQVRSGRTMQRLVQLAAMKARRARTSLIPICRVRAQDARAGNSSCSL
jgi:N-methylhydantoinase B/oxoprolinase/acetone carboxylase alpha subunit